MLVSTLHFGMSRVNLSVDAYNHKTTNMLVYQPLSPLSGFEYTLTNDGSMQNTGLELALKFPGGKWQPILNGMQVYRQQQTKNKILASAG